MDNAIAIQWAQMEMQRVREEHPEFDEYQVMEAAVMRIDVTRRKARGAMVAAVLHFWETYMVSPDLQRKYKFGSIKDVVMHMADESTAGKMTGLASEIAAIQNIVLPMLTQAGVNPQEAKMLIVENSSKARALTPAARLAEQGDPELQREFGEYIAARLSDETITVNEIKEEVKTLRQKARGKQRARKGIFYLPDSRRMIVIIAPENWRIPPSINSAEDDFNISSPKALVRFLKSTFPKEVQVELQ